MSTAQIAEWSGQFGREYTDRNYLLREELDELYRKRYGKSRTELNARFLQGIPRESRILEVGCNAGNQLELLQLMGFENLCGVELQEYALEQARSRLSGIELQQGTAFQIPYPSNSFDLVFTSGVLIHIAPEDIHKALAEIHRCSREYIWGSEYYAPSTTEIPYRGHERLLWKTDFAGLYLKLFNDLELVRHEYLPYLENPNVDCMFLLRKRR